MAFSQYSFSGMLLAVGNRMARSSGVCTAGLQGRKSLLCLHRCYAVAPLSPKFKYKSMMQLTPEEKQAREEYEKYQEALNSGSSIRRWGAIVGSNNFQKSATKWYVGLYGLFICYGIWYFRKLFVKHLEEEDLEKLRDGGATLSEYQRLRLRELKGDLLRTEDSRKLAAYLKLREEVEAKEGKVPEDFNPSPEEIADVVDLEYKNSILPPKDLSAFYDDLAQSYDEEVGTEEWFSFMGSKRTWLMEQAKGDVLEVASGTGRNVDYIDPTKINSLTFLDASKNMMEICYDKFKKKWPEFPRVKFVVGRAEDLADLSKGSDFKYDTIIETFGICSHEDPVKALKNMERLLKPGGRIVLLEHGRGTYNFINDILDRRSHKHSAKWGCRWNLDIGEIIDESGLQITEEKRAHLGTTWMLVCKRPEDPMEIQELTFFEKYVSPPRTNVDSSKRD